MENELMLSVLVCTIPNRVNDFCPKIITELSAQAEGKPVEILWLGDNKKRTTGEKRQALKELARGKYIVFVDDDDWISADYIDMILIGCSADTDCVTFKAQHYRNGIEERKMWWSVKNEMNWEDKEYYHKLIDHIVPVKRELALKAPHPVQIKREDKKYQIALKDFVKTEVHLDKVLYHYYFIPGEPGK